VVLKISINVRNNHYNKLFIKLICTNQTKQTIGQIWSNQVSEKGFHLGCTFNTLVYMLDIIFNEKITLDYF